MTDGERITLKEYFQTLLEEHERRQAERETLIDKSLEWHRAEVERRLELLNGLRQEVMKDRVIYFTREMHDVYQADIAVWRGQVNDYMAYHAGRSATIVAMVGFGVGLASVLVEIVIFLVFR